MKQNLLFIKSLMVGVLLMMGVGAEAATFYVRPFGNSTAWSNIPGATIVTLASGNVFSFSAMGATPAATGADTYYFAKGTYKLTGVISLTSGKFYGGFSGNESSVSDLSSRILSDNDGNGIVEPWEFANEVVINGAQAYTGTSGSARLMTVLGGEINGFTFYDYNYSQSLGNGAFILGQVTSAPSDGNNTLANSGTMKCCTIRKIKASIGSGIIMMTCSNSVVDKCLIEDCNVVAGNGGAIYMNKMGGTVSNCVIRNNIASGNGGAIYLGNTPSNSTAFMAVVNNCVIYNNTGGTSTSTGGGAIKGDVSSGAKGLEVINCTVVNNTTATSGTASVELTGSGVLANSIVLSDSKSEIRPGQTTNYVLSTIYGANGGSALYPGTNCTSGIADLTFSGVNFKTATTFQGAVGNSTSDASGWTLAKQNEIKAANYYITSSSSSAATTSISTLPSSYLASGGTGSSISIMGTVPGTDINNDTRNAIGAYNYDVTAPTVTITSSASSPTSTSPIPVTFTFSENITGFTASDVTVGNGTLSAITTVSAKVYTATITPSAGGAVTVDIASAKVKDGAGNDNTAATQFSITYNLATTAPIGVLTTAVSGIGSSDATSGISYASTGGSPILTSGVVWSTSSNPDVSLSSKTTDGTGNITGLSHNTTYYVRAYATNAIGTTYGNELIFTSKHAISVSAASTDGTVSGGGDFANNATVTLTAAATASGKRFINWTIGGNVVSINKSYSFAATSDLSVVANFGDIYTIYYVRPSGSSAWSNIGASTNQIITATDDANNFNLSYLADNSADGTATYYFASGTYTLNGVATKGTQLTSGKIYGGFKGNESSIDLNSRATSDLDGNGIVEPWEMTNATTLCGKSGFKYAETGTTDGERLLRIDAGGEVNGVTLTDFKYGSFSGAISIGLAGAANDNDGQQGYMKCCIVKKIKAHSGIVTLNNSRSVVDQCLIEDNYGTTSYGGVYFYKYGGNLSNSVIRNNKATTYGGAVYALGASSAPDLKAIVKNCVIYNNSAITNGGAIRCDAYSANNSGLEIVNSTIVNNSTGTGVASVELINNGLIVNSIITGDVKDELRANTTSHYVAGNVFGTRATNTTGLYPYTPATNDSTKLTTDMLFVSAPTAVGYVGIPGDAGFNQANYDAVHSANFKINNTASAALKSVRASLPATYQVQGTGTTINVYASAPTNDIVGATLTDADATAGAYQIPSNTWSGNTSTDWSTAGNWSVGVPTANVSATIPNVTNKPVIASTTSATCKNINVQTGSSLTIQSDATNSGQLQITGTATGNVTYNRYMAPAKWHLTTSPVSGLTVAEFITNNNSKISTGTSSVRGITDYNSTSNAWNGYFTDGAANGNMNAGRGFTIRLKGSSDGLVSFTGTPQTGTINTTVSQDWNCIGNPYTTALSVSALKSANDALFNSSNSGLFKAVYVWDNSGSGQYVTDATTVQAGQAFMVRVAEGITTFPLTAAMQVVNSAVAFRSSAVSDWSEVKLFASNGTDKYFTQVKFNDGMSNGVDASYDAALLRANKDFALYTRLLDGNNTDICLQALPSTTDAIPVGLDYTTGGKITFSASSFPAGYNVVLEDRVAKTFTDLSVINASYTAEVDANTQGTGRFYLYANPNKIATGLNAGNKTTSLSAYFSAGSLIIKGEVSNNAVATVYDITGKIIVSAKLKAGHIQSIPVSLSSGIYVVKVADGDMSVLIKLNK